MARICIDPGHGGSDPGAVNRTTGLRECDIALIVSQKIQTIAATDSHEVILTRETDIGVAYHGACASQELQARCNIANEHKAELFISIHCNAAENSMAHGTETFYYERSTEGPVLAQNIHAELVSVGLMDRGIKTANFYVLKYTDMPAALVEIAFISNPEEEKLLSGENWQQWIAQTIWRGVKRQIDEVGV